MSNLNATNAAISGERFFDTELGAETAATLSELARWVLRTTESDQETKCAAFDGLANLIDDGVCSKDSNNFQSSNIACMFMHFYVGPN